MCQVLDLLKKYPRKSGDTVTHTIIGKSSYNLPADETPKLYKLINKLLKNNKPVPSVLERIGPISPLIIDIDLKYKDKFTERQYTNDFLKRLYLMIREKLNLLFSYDDSNKLQMWVLEKDNILPAPQNGYESKDGIHLLFPQLISNTKNYIELIDLIFDSKEEYDKIVEETCLNPSSNDIKCIFDSAPYKNGNWYLYGCGKENEQSTYKLTNIFTINDNIINELDIDMFIDNPLEIIRKQSMILNTTKTVEYIGDQKDEPILKENTNNNNVNMNLYEFENPDNKNRIKKGGEKEWTDLVNLLSVERASENSEWVKAGYCIHSFSRTKFGYDLWIKFSQKCINKFDLNECYKQWKYMDKTAKDDMTIGTMKYWANKDNPDAYQKLRTDSLETLIRKSIMKDKTCGSHSDVANVIHKYYGEEFICSGLKGNNWYYFSSNCGKWKRTEEGHELRRRLSDDLVDIYQYYAGKYKALRGDDTDSEDYEKYDKFNTNCFSVVLRLKDGSYKDKIMKECKEKFYDEEFIDKVNSKLNLLALDNCIIDLKYQVGDECKVMFREGIPSDYITISTGYGLPLEKKDLPIGLDEALSKILEKYDTEEKNIADIDDFISKILPIEDVREYTLRFLSSCLSGEVPVHKFNIWTGSGGNGKSMLVKLMNNTLGDYAKTMDVSYITKEKGGSSAASPEIELIKFARFVPMSEPEKQDSIFAGKLKHITGGDTMTSRGLFKETSEFKPQFKMMLMCNDLPSIPSVDGGVARRLEVVDFPSKFVDNPRPNDNDKYQYKKDSTLEHKLEEWNLIFLFKLLKYYPKFLKFISEGIKAPDSVSIATGVYLTDNDLVQKWIKEDLIECDESKTLNTLHHTFIGWCDATGSNPKKVEKKEIKKALEEIQRKSKYGLAKYGDKQEDGAPNGTSRSPLFNYCSKEDE